MKPKLIALDIDGTLTDDHKEITPRTLDVLMGLQGEGARLVLASARPSPGLFRMRDRLSMRDHGGILMSYNGGRIVDAKTNRILFETHMEIRQAREILSFLKTLPVTVILDDGVQFYVEDLNGYKVAYEAANNDMICTQVKDLARFLSFAPVKILMSVLPEKIGAVQERIRSQVPDAFNVMRTAPFYLEILPKSIHKGNGLRSVCEALQIDIGSTVAFGDSENDIPMLTAAGIGVAMGNAEQAVKESADLVTASNNDDGIADALQRIRMM